MADSTPRRTPRSWLAAGVALRLLALTRAHLYFDEGNVLMLMREPLGDLLDTLRRNVVYPPGFFLLLRPTGGAEGAVRAACVAIGVAALLLFDRLVHDVLEPRAARLATLLFAVSPMAVELSTEAKMYGLELLALLLAMRAAVRSLGVAQVEPRPRTAACCAVALAVAVSCQYLAALAGVALAVTALGAPGLTRRARALVLAALVAAALAQVPWLASVAPVAHGAGSHVDVPRQLARAGLRPGQLATILVGLVSHNLPAVPGLGLRTVSGLALVALALGWASLRGAPKTLWLLIPGIFVPILAAGAIAPRYPGYGNVGKYALAAFPPLVLTLGAACARPRGLVLAAALVGLNALSLAHTFTAMSERELWHEAAAVLRARAGDPVVVWPPTALMPLCAAEPGFAPDSARVRLLPVLAYGRPVTRSPEREIFLSLAFSLAIDAEREVGRLAVRAPFTVVLGRPLEASPEARAIVEALSRRHGPARPLLARGLIPVVYAFGAN